MKVLFQESCINLNAELLKWVWQSTLLAQTHMALGFHLVFGKLSHCPCWVIHAAIRAAGCELFEPKGGSGWILATKSSEEGWTCCICESLPLVVKMNGTSNLEILLIACGPKSNCVTKGPTPICMWFCFAFGGPPCFSVGKLSLGCETVKANGFWNWDHTSISPFWWGPAALSLHQGSCWPGRRCGRDGTMAQLFGPA